MERSLKPQESSLTKRNGAHENVFNGKRAGVRACVRVFDDGECRRAAASSRVFFIHSIRSRRRRRMKKKSGRRQWAWNHLYICVNSVINFDRIHEI
jgi:hypothetical protein